VSLTIADAIPQFLETLRGRGLRESTIKRHRGALSGRGGFHAACQSLKGASPTTGQIDHQCVSRYLSTIEGVQGTRNNKLESIRQFLNWAEKRRLLRPGFTAEDLLDGAKGRKSERKPKFYIPPDRFPEALDIAGARDPRDRAVIAFLLGTLARGDSEAAPVELRHIDLDELTVQLWREKRQRWTTTAINPDMAGEMERWGAVYASEMGYLSFRAMRNDHPEWKLLPARTGWNMGFQLRPEASISVMARIVKRVLTGLGVTETEQGRAVAHVGEGAHTIRRSGAAAMFDKLTADLGFDGALLMVAAMLDHEEPLVTLEYIGRDRQKQKLNDWLRDNNPYALVAADSGEGQLLTFRRRA
jgi:hypothetical protein